MELLLLALAPGCVKRYANRQRHGRPTSRFYGRPEQYFHPFQAEALFKRIAAAQARAGTPPPTVTNPPPPNTPRRSRAVGFGDLLVRRSAAWLEPP